ncbi:unnamed protein product [Lymnaea stagnalis]|uniref:EF-hand domain-containing protein n=1 Tax=Lymnaea stagnalis TaxID=6523 RepID=A0AAV2I6B3_LYMST
MSGAAESFEQRVKIFFDKANGGNPITVGQLCRVITSACPNFKGTHQEIAQMFMEIDSDSDKLISWDEFRKALLAKEHKEVTRTELEIKFKELDTDKSGKLDIGEVRKLLKALKINVSEDHLNKLFKAADPNNDGAIDFEEFLKAWAE